jgi:hypothetical protein
VILIKCQCPVELIFHMFLSVVATLYVPLNFHDCYIVCRMVRYTHLRPSIVLKQMSTIVWDLCRSLENAYIAVLSPLDQLSRVHTFHHDRNGGSLPSGNDISLNSATCGIRHMTLLSYIQLYLILSASARYKYWEQRCMPLVTMAASLPYNLFVSLITFTLLCADNNLVHWEG